MKNKIINKALNILSEKSSEVSSANLSKFKQLAKANNFRPMTAKEKKEYDVQSNETGFIYAKDLGYKEVPSLILNNDDGSVNYFTDGGGETGNDYIDTWLKSSTWKKMEV